MTNWTEALYQPNRFCLDVLYQRAILARILIYPDILDLAPNGQMPQDETDFQHFRWEEMVLTSDMRLPESAEEEHRLELLAEGPAA